MVKAIVAIEDYRFYQHGALDLKGTLRAFVTNQANDGVGPGRLVDHPADGQADAAQPGRDQGGARRPRPTTPTPASSASCATRSPSSRSTPRTGSSSATSTSPTSATAPTASRPPRGTTSPSQRQASSTCASPRCSPAWCKNPTGYDPTNNPERARERRNVVLDRMAELNVITDEQGRRRPRSGSSASTSRRRQQRLRQLAGAVLLRLRRELPARRTRRSARPSRSAGGCSRPAA